MTQFSHPFPFDPSYGHTLETFRAISPPEEPADFIDFWQARYARAIATMPTPQLTHAARRDDGFDIFDIRYRSTDGFDIAGWLIRPATEEVERGIVVGHGYGGRDGPDLDLPVANAAFLFPCFRGLSRSRHPPISENPAWHVLHNIQDRDRYILGGCVEDLWLGVSALLDLFPETAGRIGYMGISFGGGIGSLAIPWDERIRRAHLNVPTFGHQPLRLSLPTVGSGAAIRTYESKHGHVLETLRYYDAASAAQHTKIPVHIAAALFDPAVAPPGQFAIFNALAGPKSLYLLDAGHFDYPRKAQQERELKVVLQNFFSPL